MGNTIRNEFNILRLIDSQKRGADPREAKQERGLTELIRQRCPVAAERAGCPLPTAQLLRDLQLTQGSSGAALAGAIHNPLERLAGAARPATVLDRAGIASIQIDDGQEASVPRWRGGAGSWLTEGEVLTDSGLTLSSVSSSAHNAAAVVVYSRRLRSSTTEGLQEQIISEMRRGVVEVVESGLLNGSGNSGQPLGLIQQSSSGITFAGPVATFAELTAMIEALGDGNGDPGRASWLLHPSDAAALARTERASGTGLMCLEATGLRQWAIAGLPVLTSTNVPEGTVILLDSRAATVINYGPPQLIVDPFSGSNSVLGNTSIIVSNFVDMAVSEPDLIVVGSA